MASRPLTGRFIAAMLASLLAINAAGARDAPPAPVKRAIDLPPSADLVYNIKARQKGFTLGGDAIVNWRAGNGRYSFHSDTRAQFLGSMIDDRSEGSIDSFGLAPNLFTEKRVRHDPWTTTFERGRNIISFTESKVTYPIKGGEQDRSSVLFQLAGMARAAPESVVAGAEWKFFVAGRRDADVWTFRVVKPEVVQTGIGKVDAIHLIRLPPPDSKDQTLDIWLAPSKEWYPVRIRFTDNDDEYVDQTLQSINKR